MSWRIVFLPFDGQTACDLVDWCDDVVGVDATDEELAEVAARWRWQQPLAFLADDAANPRLHRVQQMLEEEYAMPAETYTVWVSTGTGDLRIIEGERGGRPEQDAGSGGVGPERSRRGPVQ